MNNKKKLICVKLVLLMLMGGCEEYRTDKERDPIKKQDSLSLLKSEPNPCETKPSVPWKKQGSPRKIKQIPAIFKKPVTINIGENVSLKSALIALSQQSGVDLQLEAGIDETLIYSAHQRPLVRVIKDICDLTGLRYLLLGKAIQIKKDTPYPQNYNVQFLNVNRETRNSTSIATDIFTKTDQSDTSSGNGSSSRIQSETGSDFWSEVERNLLVILGDPKHMSREGSGGTFTIHRQAGIVTVNTTSRYHALVEDYLDRLKKTTGTQVLIEAKIIEVNLKEEFKAGIDWRHLTIEGVQAHLPLGNFAREGKLLDPMHNQGNILTLGYRADHFSGILKAIQEYGACKTLSSPRLTVLNNQNAILKVAKNQVYFRLRYDRQYNYSIDRDNLTVQSDIQTVPIGLVMSVQPSIDERTGKILLSLRPTISRLSRSIPDPAVDIAFAAAGAVGERPPPSLIPVVDVREIDTLIETEPGKIVVLGGLMESRKAFEENKLPGVGDIPILGKLVTGQSESDEVVELVILLKCTLANDGIIGPDAADRRLIDEFVDDPRSIHNDIDDDLDA